MITERAKASFDRLLVASLRSGLGGAGVRVGSVASLERIRENRIVILTVSSYLFRLMAVLYFKPDAGTRAWFDRGDGLDAHARAADRHAAAQRRDQQAVEAGLGAFGDHAVAASAVSTSLDLLLISSRPITAPTIILPPACRSWNVVVVIRSFLYRLAR